MVEDNNKTKVETTKNKTKINIPIQYILPIKEIKKLSKNRTFKLLDVGAGVRDIKKFLPKNITYFSLDYTKDVKHNIILDLDKGDDGDGHLPIKSNSFDIILCLETLEHLQNPYKTMEELIRISKQNTIFFLSMPNEYNFWLRFLYLLGIKDKMKEPFQVVNKHLHIHLPRVKDIKKFFSSYIYIDEVHYGWNSYRAPKIFDKILNKLCNLWPSMFTRVVVVKGTKKDKE